MQYLINLHSQEINGVQHWGGGVAPVRPLNVQHNTSIAQSESVLTRNKNTIINEIERRLQNENFITNQIIHDRVRVGSVQELTERLNQVQ